jgi:hypothetical protein
MSLPAFPHASFFYECVVAKLVNSGKIFLLAVMMTEENMNAALVREKLVEVLTEIQSASGLDCPPLEGTLKPVEALPEFDSKIWPVAIGILAAKLEITIDDDVNIFRQDKSCIALTLDQTVDLVVAIANSQEAVVAVAGRK